MIGPALSRRAFLLAAGAAILGPAREEWAETLTLSVTLLLDTPGSLQSALGPCVRDAGGRRLLSLENGVPLAPGR